jgi:hypothetical protein
MSAVIDSLCDSIAVVNEQGLIISVNQAWRTFADNNGGSADLAAGIGIDYLATLRRAAASDPFACAALQGSAAVLAGRQTLFTLEYPFNTPDGEHWFELHVTPLQGAVKGMVVGPALTHDPAQSGSFAGSPAFAAGAVKSRGAGGRRARDTRVEWGSWRGFREVSGTPVRSLDEPFPARTMPYGGMLGPSWADHSSCSRKGSARSPRIRAESSQGAAQEVRMKRIAPRTPN